MKTTEMKKEVGFSPKKVEKCIKEMIKVLQENKLTYGELIIMMGNLTYSVGHSMEGIQDEISAEDLKKLYYVKPTAGLAMMATGLTMTTWYDDHKAQLLNKAKTEE